MLSCLVSLMVYVVPAVSRGNRILRTFSGGTTAANRSYSGLASSGRLFLQQMELAANGTDHYTQHTER